MAAIYGQSDIVVSNDMQKLAKWEEDAVDSLNRKTKIICTMGPSCWEVDKLCEIIDCGMNVARLNFSHGDHEGHGACVARIREAAKLRPSKHVAILLDTKGPEIRTGFFKPECGGKVTLEKDKELKLVTDYDFKGDETCFACTYKSLPTAMKPGNIILCADGSLSLKVKECGPDFVITTIMNNCTLGERKNMNLPGVQVDLPVLQEKDKNDLLKFGIPQGVDFVAASFVQSADDVREIRNTLGTRGRAIKIMSKIENEAGLRNFDEILKETDAVMVARGDLGMEIPPEKVFLAQKMMIAKCNIAGKPVVTATQMLESMTKAPRPTRAEASDVANAVLDGTDCVMLSGETAGGDFPVNAVTIMRRICEEAEAVIDYKSLYMTLCRESSAVGGSMTTVESVCSAAVKTAVDAKCPLLLALTETGHTAHLLAKYRPAAAILAVTASETTARQLLIVRGVITMHTASFQGTDSVIKKAVDKAKQDGLVKSGDSVVAIHGQKEECPGHSNLLKVVAVP